MKTMTEQELMSVDGGAIKWGIAALIAAGVTFIAGVIDGIVRPLRCN